MLLAFYVRLWIAICSLARPLLLLNYLVWNWFVITLISCEPRTISIRYVICMCYIYLLSAIICYLWRFHFSKWKWMYMSLLVILIGMSLGYPIKGMKTELNLNFLLILIYYPVFTQVFAMHVSFVILYLVVLCC